MASIKELAKGRSDIYRVSPRDLAIKDGWNSREMADPANVEHIDMLARSIAEEGVKQPLTVYMEGGKLFIEDGHCRYLAALKAMAEYGAPEDLLVPVRMGEKDATEADRIFGQIIRNSGKPLSPLEQATVFKRLSELGWSDGDIARKAGISRVYVGHLITLIDAPKAIVDLVRTGMVSATLAIETIKEYGDRATELLRAAVTLAIESGKTKATKKHVRQVAGEGKKDDPEPEDVSENDPEPDEATGEDKDDGDSDKDDAPEPREKKPNLKRVMKGILDKAEIRKEMDGDKGLVGLIITSEEYEQIVELLEIEDLI